MPENVTLRFFNLNGRERNANITVNTLLYLFEWISPAMPVMQLNCNWRDSSAESTQQSSSSSLRCWWRCLGVFFQHKSLFPLQGKHKLFTFVWALKCNLQCKIYTSVKNCPRQVTCASNLLGKLHSHSPCTVSLVNLCISHTIIMTREAWASWADWLTVQILSKKQSLPAKGS